MNTTKNFSYNSEEISHEMISENQEIKNPQEIQIIDNQSLTNLPRIDWQYVKDEFLSVFGYDSGFFYTLKMLLIRPAESIKTYLTSHRQKLTKPLVFLFFTAFIFSQLNDASQWSSLEIEIENSKIGNAIKHWLTTNYGYSVLLIILFTAFWMRFFFRRKQLHFFEFAVILCYTKSFEMMISVVGMGVSVFFKSQLIDFLFFMLSFIYSFWVVGGIFGRKFRSYWAYFWSYLLGLLSFVLIIALFVLFEHFYNKLIIN